MKEVGITNTIQTKNPGKNAEQTPDGIPENQDSQYHWQEEEIKKKKGILIGISSLIERLSVRV